MKEEREKKIATHSQTNFGDPFQNTKHIYLRVRHVCVCECYIQLDFSGLSH